MLELYVDVAHINNVFCCLVLLEVADICDIGCEVGFTIWPADQKPCKIRELLIALQPLLLGKFSCLFKATLPSPLLAVTASTVVELNVIEWPIL
jgi:hypothetical protein